MYKIILSLAALAALSTASFAAGNRNNDLRDSEYYTTQGYSAVQSDSAALAFADGTSGLTSFERTTLLSKLNDQGRH